MRLLEIPDALREFGLEPVQVAGWQTRGLEFSAAPRIHLRHWTAGSRVGKAGSLGIVTHGRSDLPGPLAQVLQERTGGSGLDRVYVVASGRANHAGVGSWAGVTSGNSNGTGNEIEWSGPAENFPANRIETSVRVAAALQSLHPSPLGRYCCEHREYAIPPGRKIDTNLNGDVFRQAVQNKLNQGADMAFSAEQEAVIVQAATLIARGAPAFGVPNWTQVALSIDGVDVGSPGDRDYRQSLRTFIKDENHKTRVWIRGTATPEIAAAVVAALPPSSGGSGGPSITEIQAAVEDAVEAAFSKIYR